MKFIIFYLFLGLAFADDKTGYENITTYKDTYRTKAHPEFKSYLVNYFKDLPNNPKRTNPLFKKYKTVPVFFEDSLEKEIDLPVNIPLSQICYFYKSENMNVLAINKNYWEKLSKEDKDTFFNNSYDSCRFKSIIN